MKKCVNPSGNNEKILFFFQDFFFFAIYYPQNLQFSKKSLVRTKNALLWVGGISEPLVNK